jgi:hypothetical protein
LHQSGMLPKWRLPFRIQSVYNQSPPAPSWHFVERRNRL